MRPQAGRGEADRPGVALLSLCLLAVLAPFNVNSPIGSGRLEVALRPLLLLQLTVSLAIVLARLVKPEGSGRPWPPRLLLMSAGAMVLFVSLSAVASDDRVMGAGGAVTAFALAITVIATAMTVRSATDVRLLLRWVAVGTAAGAAIGLVVFVSGTEHPLTEIFAGRVTRLGLRPRVTRPWGHANVAAMAMAPAVALLGVGLLGTRRSWFRPEPRAEPGGNVGQRRLLTAVPTLLLVLITVALVLTYSRAGLAAAVIGAVVAATGLVWSGLVGGRVAAASTVALLAVMAVAGVATPGWQNRFDSTATTKDFEAEVAAPATIRLGPDGLTVPITVTNRSGLTWPANGPNRIQLSARWLVADGDRVVAEQRWPLPDDVGPGRSLTFDVTVNQNPNDQITSGQTTSSKTDPNQTPADDRGPEALADGRYLVAWDLLLDQEAYFLQFSGQQATSDATVFNSPTGSNTAVEAVPLVAPLVDLTRSELWTIAWDAFAGSPLLGVGPMQLPTFAEPRLDTDQRLVGGHAHNMVLEALATWGLLGTVPLLALILGGVWRPARRIAGVRATRTSHSNGDRWTDAALVDAAVLGALVAVGVHAMVEWQLDEVGVAIPIALLLGIAWSRYGPQDGMT